MKRHAGVVFGVMLCAMTASAASADASPWELSPRWAWLPGTLLGVIGGSWGGLAGCLAPKGRGRTAVLTSGVLLSVACGFMLVLGVTLLLTGQGWGAWYPWLLPGVIGVLAFPGLLTPVRHRYQEAEMRRLESMDITDM